MYTPHMTDIFLFRGSNHIQKPSHNHRMCSAWAFGKTQWWWFNLWNHQIILLKYEMVNGLGSSQQDHQGFFDRILLVPSSVVRTFSSSNEFISNIQQDHDADFARQLEDMDNTVNCCYGIVCEKNVCVFLENLWCWKVSLVDKWATPRRQNIQM